MTEATTSRNYKSTLQLPQTSFNMRANLAQNEPASLKRWEESKFYERITSERAKAGLPRFAFHDGPPYANATLHVGHLLNKVLKDFVVRTHLLMGMQCPYVPGWDCHGLPIEHKVMTDLFPPGGEKAAKIDALPDDQRRMAIRRECAKHAEKSIKLQMMQMKRMLTLADYEHPYLTMAPRYEQRVLEVFATMVERGLVYRALKPVHWSIANQTALAEAELEYEDREDPSIYVDFEAMDRESVARAFEVELDQTPSFMIWTTTPWTLPANLAIAVHEKFRYALVKVDGNITVIAEELVEKVTKVSKAESVEVLATTEGRNLLGLTFKHPFCDDALLGKPRALVAADYVTLEDGTGLVHTAPGHGAEDYRTGVREELPIYCPVQGDGTFDSTAPKWLHGKSVWEANDLVTEHLRTSGHLFAAHKFTHSYPHDWRSKTPVIFRATEQWFIGVDLEFSSPGSAAASLRQRAISVAEREVEFYPEWGRNRLRGMLEARPDWCISRQRSWGLPIPAFHHKDTGQVLLTPGSVRAIAALVGAKGSDVWFQSDAATLLANYDLKGDPDAPAWAKESNFDKSSLIKSADIFDVWFESGSSWNAVLRDRDLGYPAELYLEGSDQHRGWFQLSLLPALAVTGQSPFRGLLTHGFIVDKDGRKMSKSLGNTLEVDDLLKEYGADVCRWWVSSLAFENDIKMDKSFFDAAGETYRKVRNTLRFLLSNLFDFKCTPNDPGKGGLCGDCVDISKLPGASLDAWALAEAAQVERAVLASFEQYEFRKAHQLLYDFCNDTLSAVYCAAVKDRLYCDAPEGQRRRTTQTVMWVLTEMLCRLLAPIMPHTADEAYRALWRDEAKTIHNERKLGLDFAADPDWSVVMDTREQALKALDEAKQRGVENPLDAEVVLPDPKGVLKKFQSDLADLLGVSRVKLTAGGGEIAINDLRDEPRCERSWKRDGTVKQRSDSGMLCDRCAEALGM